MVLSFPQLLGLSVEDNMALKLRLAADAPRAGRRAAEEDGSDASGTVGLQRRGQYGAEASTGCRRASTWMATAEEDGCVVATAEYEVDILEQSSTGCRRRLDLDDAGLRKMVVAFPPLLG